MVFHILDCLRPRKLEDGTNDRISGLPDDILVHIVSLLPHKEAARTCILSKRWQEIQSFCGRFDFHSQVIFGSPESKGILVRHRRKKNTSEELRCNKYVEWVNSVLRSARNAVAIDEFRIQFDLTIPHEEDIHEWLNYAFARKVKRLELSPYGSLGRGSVLYYVFPNRSLLDLSGGRFLRSLSLRGVSVDADDVKAFLQTFRFLEFLGVRESRARLTRVEVCDPSLVLKHLVITSCGYVSLIIRDTHSLVHLEADYGSINDLEIENAPNLVHARFPVFELPPYFPAMEEYQLLPSLPAAFLSRLQFLTLDTVIDVYRLSQESNIYVTKQLTELKHLSLDASSPYPGPTHIISLISKELPKLEKLVVKVSIPRWIGSDDLSGLNFHLHRLKIAEFHGYAGRSKDDELVTMILENAPALQTLMIRPRMKNTANKAAMKLKRLVNPSVQFLIV